MTASANGYGEMPDEWPKDLPVPPGAEPIRTTREGGGVRVSFSAPPGIDLEAFFGSELHAAGWQVEEAGASEGDVGWEILGHGFYGRVELYRPVSGVATEDGAAFWVDLAASEGAGPPRNS